METYIGTKILQAKPMNRLDYNVLRGWKLPEDENGADAGYLVEYLDGGTPNLAGFAGYVSWSPAAQFEAAYLKVPNAAGQPAWLVRLLGEEAQLSDKITKLKTFLGGETSKRIEDVEFNDLSSQLTAMIHYREILLRRIARHTKV